MSKLKGPDGRIPDRLPDGRPAVAWERRWTEGTLPLWLVATAGGIAVIFCFRYILLWFIPRRWSWRLTNSYLDLIITYINST